MSDESPNYCRHGDLQRINRYGVDTDEHGGETCRGCGLPVWGTGATRVAPPAPIVLSTLAEVPGRVIVEVLGIVTGIGHPVAPVFTATATRGAGAHQEASADLIQAARALGADAVVGIHLGVYTGGNRSTSQAIGVHLLGTAVRTTPVDDGAV